jgi:hypothetical protein
MSERPTEDSWLYFNGINGDEGQYELPPLNGTALVEIIRGEKEPTNLDELRGWNQFLKQKHLGILEGFDPNQLDEAGWGAIFTHDADPQIKEALQPLLDLRRAQAGKFYCLFEGAKGYWPGKSKSDFLRENSAGPGPANPEKVPYYLLLIGSPEQIPYQFQTQLDVQYSVGRIHFDTPQGYANYAESVVKAETGDLRLLRTATFFGVANADDPATRLSSSMLVQPLFDKFAAEMPDWSLSAVLKEQATKQQLSQLLGGDPHQTPALLFSASHGMGFNHGSPRQLSHQGALLCQDWPGPKRWKGPIPDDFYFSGEDIASSHNLLGMIAFFFACYGAGTPELDQFSKTYFKDRAAIAPRSFLANLPVRMLANPGGGALAVIGHIERAWGYSFKYSEQGTQNETFESTLRALLGGKTVGYAVEFFNERYAELSTILSDELEQIEFQKKYDPYDLAALWTANNDARGYAIIGDPAVRLPVTVQANGAAPRPQIQPVQISGPTPVIPPPNEPASGQPPAGQEIKPSAQKEQTNRSEAMDKSFTPLPIVPESLNDFPVLQQAWIDHVRSGYKNTDSIFRNILRAFLISHYSTVIMYWLLFLLGGGLFAAGFFFDNLWVTVVGAFGAAAFVMFFLARSAQSLEQNLLYITWLGIVYNTYWVHQLWSSDPQKSQQELEAATKESIRRLNELIDRYEASYKKRPVLKEKPSQGSETG